MSDNSIDNLKRKLEDAEARKREADACLSSARDCYNSAVGAAMLEGFAAIGGEVGKTRVRIVHSYGRREGKADMSYGPYIVVGVKSSYSGMCFALAKIKKDGTASLAAVGHSPKCVAIVPEDNT